MNVNPQIINQDGNPAFVVLSIKDYNSIIESLEDIEDLETIRNFNLSDEETFPLELINQITTGENPIKVYRKYRKLSQAKLASNVGVSKQYISQLEKNERSGSTKIMQCIAKKLKVDLDDLL